MKFSTRMLLMSALLSVSFLAAASPPTAGAVSIDFDQVDVSVVSPTTDVQFAVAVRIEEYMPMLQRVSDSFDQRLPNLAGWQASTPLNHYRPPAVTANSGIGRHTQHRT
jgi:hypothetical protein